MPDNFTVDPKLQQVAEAYALDAVDFAAQVFEIALDWSDASIIRIEEIADGMHRSIARDKPTRARIAMMAKMLGSYVGEVYRRNHGADWGESPLFGAFGALRATKGGAIFSPWAKMMMRLENGDEDNIAAYYHVLTRP